MPRSLFILIAAIAGASACGGAPPPPTAAEPSPGTPPIPSTFTLPADKTFDDLTKPERMAVMKNEVVPKMSALFQAQDPKRFKDFSCETCHGKGAEDGTFAMPNPALPKLSPKDGFKKHMEKTPEMTKFMMEKVVPSMAGTLHLKQYDPATKTGFGCHNCHQMEE